MATRNRRKNGSWCVYQPESSRSDCCTTNPDNRCLVKGTEEGRLFERQASGDTTNSKHEGNNYGVNVAPRKHSDSLTSQPQSECGKYHRDEIVHGPVQEQRTAPVMSSRLRRAFSANEFKTRLTCPKGLLITTEAPKSGEFYRRRSNTDVGIGTRNQGKECSAEKIQANDSPPYDCIVAEKTSGKKKEPGVVENVRKRCAELEKENERLHEELENRNQVIDHLIDYMKSIVSQGLYPTEDVFVTKQSLPNGTNNTSFTNI